MTPEAQRIAIAEVCNLPKPYSMWFGKIPDTPCHSVMVRNGVKHGIPIPDYLNDLNAMAEAEKVLDYEQLADMAEFIGVDADQAPADSWNILLRATASQRAEALLRTLGKWKETSK
jgi:hypothetical protein